MAVSEYRPECAIFLDLAPAEAFARNGGADKTDRIESVDYSFHEKVYNGYKQLIAQNPEKFVVIDASGTKEQTQQKLREVLRKKGVIK